MNLFNTYQPFICDGDIAIVYQGHHDLYPMGIVAGNVMNDKSGSYKHDDFIGQPWGSKV
ncbi:hypothetical protein HMI56_005852 [Coelomomyces lativittatus]|nr:hypothetical protein HMI56_005852 [Coelomomyces lativittatus]